MNKGFVIYLKGGSFDLQQCTQARIWILKTASKLRARDGYVSKQSLAREMKSTRGRVATLVKTLGIKGIFDDLSTINRGAKLLPNRQT